MSGLPGLATLGVHGRELWHETYAEEQLDEVAARVTAELRKLWGVKPFCLWLTGDLGAGKTTLTGYLLRVFGLPEGIPVTSPTYTYMNDYQIGTDWYGHLDLYRARPDHQSLTSEDLALADGRPFRGLFVEWPERLIDDPHLIPTHVLQIESCEGGARRRYRMHEVEGGA